MPPAVTVAILRSTAAFKALSPTWIELWQRDPHATPFSRPEWLLPWWRCFGQPGLRVAVLWQADLLIGILPLYIFCDPHSGERQLLLVGAGTSDYLDGIFCPSCGAEQVLAAIAVLREEGGWDVAHLTQLRPHSPLFQALARLPLTDIRPYPGESTSRRSAVPIAELPRKIRADLRYHQNSAIGHGPLSFTCADASNAAETFELLVHFHTSRWNDAGEAGVLADPAVLAWHRDAIPRLLGSGLLRVGALRLAGEVIAVLYSLIDPASHAQRTQYFYLMGFALDQAELRPGMLLTGLAIEHAAGEGVQTIDMLRGDEVYKRFWHMQALPTFGFAVSPLTLNPGTHSASGS